MRLLAIPLLLSALAASAGDKRPLDDGWQFSLDGSDAWETVDLPHDWSVTFDFDSIYPAGNDGGYVRTGRGHYRKNLSLQPEEMKRVHNLYLEGVYMNSTVVVNGDTIGHRPYGYSSMIYDITPSWPASMPCAQATIPPRPHFSMNVTGRAS